MRSFARSLAFAVALASAPVAAQTAPEKPVPAVAAPAPPAAAAPSEKPAPSAKPLTAPGYLRPTAGGPEKPTSAAGTRPESGGAWRGFVAVGFVALLGGAALYVRKKRGAPPLLGSSVKLHTIGALQLSPKASLALVSVGNEVLLVSVSDQGVQTLRTYVPEEFGSLTVGSRSFESTLVSPTPSAPAETESSPYGAARAPSAAQTSYAQPSYAQQAYAAQPSYAQPGFTPSAASAASGAPAHQPAQAFRDLLAEAARAQRAATTEPLRVVRETALGPGAPADEEVPPHLAALLAETETPRDPAAARSREAFGEPEGQASELVRRFKDVRA